MDAQRLENLMVSMIADNATQAGGDGIPIVDVDFIPGPLMNHWAERNKKRPAVLPMTSKKDKNGTVISEAQVAGWTPPTQMPPALAGLLQYTGTAIQQITGASQLENMPSNVATDTVDSIFNRMDTQSYIYMDNMAKSMRRAGVVWLSMAREVYGSDTPMRIVNEDGSDDVALMTGEVVDRQTGQVIALNDLSQGNYEVTVDVGQSFATRRDATVKSLLSMLALIPPGTPKHDLVSSMILDNMDGEGMDDLKEYNRNQLLLSGLSSRERQKNSRWLSRRNNNRPVSQIRLWLLRKVSFLLVRLNCRKRRTSRQPFRLKHSRHRLMLRLQRQML